MGLQTSGMGDKPASRASQVHGQFRIFFLGRFGRTSLLNSWGALSATSPLKIAMAFLRRFLIFTGTAASAESVEHLHTTLPFMRGCKAFFV